MLPTKEQRTRNIATYDNNDTYDPEKLSRNPPVARYRFIFGGPVCLLEGGDTSPPRRAITAIETKRRDDCSKLDTQEVGSGSRKDRRRLVLSFKVSVTLRAVGVSVMALNRTRHKTAIECAVNKVRCAEYNQLRWSRTQVSQSLVDRITSWLTGGTSDVEQRHTRDTKAGLTLP